MGWATEWGAGAVLGVAAAAWVPVGPVALVGLLAAAGVGVAARVPRSFLAAGLAAGLLAVATMPQGPRLDGVVSVQGVVVATVGRSADVALSRVAQVGAPWRTVAGRVRVRFPERPPGPGARVLVRGRAAPYAPPVLPGAPDPVAAAARAGVRTEVWASAAAVLGGEAGRGDPFAGARHGEVLRALATGDRSGVDEATWGRLRRTGTAHLLAISGYHVGLVALLAGLAARWPLRAVAVVHPRGVGDGVAWWVGAAAAVAYAGAAGFPVSAQRAAALVVLAALGRTLHRPVDLLDALALVAGALALLDPGAVGTAGFQLSFGAVLGLVRITPLVLRYVPPDLPWVLTWATRGVAATLGATAGTLPAAAWWFQALAPLSPVANLLALPWVACAVVPPALVAGWGPQWLAGPATWVGGWAVEGLLAALSLVDVPPWTPAVGPVGALVLLVAVAWPRRSTWLAAVVVLALGVPRVRSADLVLTFLDVGQGDAVLVEHGDGRTWLVDGGPPSERVLHWLRRRGTRHLDRVVATHGHADHLGGLVPVVRHLDVDLVLVGEWEGSQELVLAAVERGIPVGLVAPLVPRGVGNDASAVVAVEHEGVRAMLLGDVEAGAEAALVAGGLPLAAVVKVAHHGSCTSSTPALIHAVRPAVAVVSVGRGNRHGHPCSEAVRRWRGAGSAVLRTDRLGTVEVSLGHGLVRVRNRPPGGPWRYAGAHVAHSPGAPIQPRAGPGPAQARAAPPGGDLPPGPPRHGLGLGPVLRWSNGAGGAAHRAGAPGPR